MEANSTGGQGLRRAAAPSGGGGDDDKHIYRHQDSLTAILENLQQMCLYIKHRDGVWQITYQAARNTQASVPALPYHRITDVVIPQCSTTLADMTVSKWTLPLIMPHAMKTPRN